ncbi:hypothetical protein [Halocola ammonii]
MLNNQVKAATLLETTVAMAIVLITLSTSLIIYINLYPVIGINSDQNCFQLAISKLADIKQSGNFEEEEEMINENLQISTRIYPYENDLKTTLSVIEIEVLTKDGNQCSLIREIISK